jgi:hypothetical protein
VDFTKEEINELKITLASAIEGGYDTNEVTKKTAHKLLSVEEMKWLDENANVGIKLL